MNLKCINFKVVISLVTFMLGVLASLLWSVYYEPVELPNGSAQRIATIVKPAPYQKSTLTCNPAHHRFFVFSYSKLKEGERGCYEFSRRTRLGRYVVPAGTIVLAEVAKDKNGQLRLETDMDAIIDKQALPKGTRLPFNRD